MKLATWNINGLRARLDFALHWLEARQPDIVGLQELKLTNDLFPHAEFEALGYHSVVHGQPAWNGVAVLSRQQARTLDLGLPGEEAQGARLVAVEVEELNFITVYCPNGKHVGHEDFPRKLDWFQSLHRYLDSRFSARDSLVLTGDFNICPGALDSWNEEKLAGKIFHTEEERRRYQDILDWGMVDSFRKLYPDEQLFSWWDYRAGAFHRNQGLRIDLLLVTEPLVRNVRKVWIDRDYRKKKEGLTPSDHAPVLAELD